MRNYGIKVGSGLVTNGDGKINQEFILSVCRQAAEIIRRGDMVFIFSSGAIASEPDITMSDNLRAIIGQPDVIGLYKNFFGIFKIKAGQLLITDADLERGVIQRVMTEAFSRKVVVVLNANDGTDDKEIEANQYCADNDVALNNVCLIPGISVNGVVIGFDRPGVQDHDGNILRVVRENERKEILDYAVGKSPSGHGPNGGRTKFSVAGNLAANGIPTVLALGQEKDFILRAIERIDGATKDDFGTLFLPS